ncbi:Carbohydrate diacid regulator [Anoxybacillus sp. BCO1]|nr:Carbohydrate diacid regulator [Anoxybacillus sp. BCO1]
MLSSHLAKKIVSDVRRLIHEDIIIVDTNGIIMASTDTTRIGQFHEGAFLVCQEKKKRIITKQDEGVLKGVKAGVNLPIFFTATSSASSALQAIQRTYRRMENC